MLLISDSMQCAINQPLMNISETGIKTLVAFSGTVKDGNVAYKENDMNGFKESEFVECFATDEYQSFFSC
ncbi:MAG TPA: hypothetical protein VIK77_05550 [Tissierellaceae bacterium]